jgi:NAD+ diphosphatase
MTREPPPLGRSDGDRAAALRADDDWLERAWAHPASRVIVVESGRALVDVQHALVRTPTADAPAGERYFLGVQNRAAIADAVGLFAVAARLPDPLLPGVRAVTIREVGALLSDADAGLLAHAAALEQWHALHPRCPRCGAATVVVLGGHVRRCVDDGSEHHPRTDPAVIMLVTDPDDRCLLGHQANWPPGRMSTLAGFVEAGETLEHAVVREVAEEVGLAVDDVRYVASQPWPFPSSLMLAFTARAQTTELDVDGVEITEARWFSRPQLRAAIADGSLRLPMRASVAFYLIEEWFGIDASGRLADVVLAIASGSRD